MIAFNLESILIVLCCVSVAAFAHGYSGFGFGIISITAFSMTPLHLERAAAITTVLNIVILSILYMSHRKEWTIHWRHVWVLCIGAFLGQPMGYYLLMHFQHLPLFRLFVGIIFIYYGINGFRAVHAHRPLPRIIGFLLGIFSGIIGGAMVSGGPPLIYYLYSQTRDPRDMKGTIQVVFLITTTYRLNLVGFQGAGFSLPLLALAGCALPATIFLILLGHRLSRRGSVIAFKRSVYTLLVVFGIVVVTKSLLHIFQA